MILLVLAATGCSQRNTNQGKTFPDGWGQDQATEMTSQDMATETVPQDLPGDPDLDDLATGDLNVPETTTDEQVQDLEPEDIVSEEWETLPSGACLAQPALLWTTARDHTLPARANRAPLKPDLDSVWQRNRLPGSVTHMDPLPPALAYAAAKSGENIVMPQYDDTMPVLVQPFDGQKHCYELPDRAVLLTESQAYDMYRTMAQLTTGHPFNATFGRRSVIGLRGSSQGVMTWNGNTPNVFNDTLVLLWRESDGTRRVLEFPAHTDTGVNDFGTDNSSSLWPNRHYPYRCGWHKNYNALAIDIVGYQVRDDTNKNGHWDSDRNQWLPSPLGIPGDDHDRGGSAHNIHMGSIDGPFSQATVDMWSAGCQVIPGLASWEVFIQNAWTKLGDPVDYYLLDVRDIDPGVWNPCEVADGSHACPFYVDTLPFQYQGNTAVSGFGLWDQYNCSPASEAGPELVFVWRTQTGGTLRATLDDVPNDVGPDIDIHLLMGDDPLACIARNDITFDSWVPPGRYVVIADTYFSDGQPQVGPFQMDLDLVPDAE